MPYSVKRDWQHGKPSSLKNSEEIKKSFNKLFRSKQEKQKIKTRQSFLHWLCKRKPIKFYVKVREVGTITYIKNIPFYNLLHVSLLNSN